MASNLYLEVKESHVFARHFSLNRNRLCPKAQ